MKAGLIIVLAVLALIVIIGAFLLLNLSPPDDEGVVCTADVALCPDGSYVNRVAPNCKFANCPEIETNNQTNNQTQQPNQSSPQTYNIEINNFKFQTAELTINAGDTIIWTNKESIRHTVTSDSGTELNSDYLSENRVYSHTFNQTGAFDYHCKPHPYMKGKIIVRENEI